MGNRRAKDIIKKLVDAGFLLVSQKGSHKKFKRGKLVVIVPEHGGKDLGIGIIRKNRERDGRKAFGLGVGNVKI